MDDFVCDFERQPGEEIKEYEPLRHAMLKLALCEGCVPLHRKQSGAYSAHVVEAQDEEDEGEHVIEENEASDDELEAEYREAVAMMTIA